MSGYQISNISLIYDINHMLQQLIIIYIMYKASSKQGMSNNIMIIANIYFLYQ
jgi:hypothetical protein